MAFVSFSNDGYDYCDEGRYVLFSEDKTHDLLFDYVSKDLTGLSLLLELYVSKRMNVISFELSDYPYNDNDYKKIIRILKSTHPYYKHEYRAVFMQAIGEYLNALLANAKYRERYIEDRSDAEWERWYFERFKKLVPPCLEVTDKIIDRFYDAYLTMTGYDVSDTIEEVSVPVVPEARGFSTELRAQEAVKWMLFFILDISAPGIRDFTIPQRAWLYGKKFKSVVSSLEVKVTTQRSFGSNMLFRKNHDHSREAEQLNELEDIFIPVYNTFKNNHINYGHLSPEMLEALSSVAAYTMTESTFGLYEECEIDNLHQLLYLEIMLMVQAGTEIRRCKHCGMYFIVTDRKEAYCDRKTGVKGECCSEVGSKSSWQTKLKKDPLLKAFTRARKTHHARWKQHGIMTEIEYKSWVYEARKRLDEVREKVKNGETDISEFETWLKK